MIAFVLVALVIAVVVAGALHLAVGGGAGRTIAGLTVSLALVVVLLVSLGGLGGGGDDEPHQAAESSEPTAPPAPVPLQPSTIHVHAPDPDDLPPVPQTVGELEAGAAVVVGVSGLDGGSSATVHQCPSGAVEPRDCRPGLPFIANDLGRATVVVDLDDRFATDHRNVDAVECSEASCSIVVFGSSRLEVTTVFGQTAPPPVTVEAEPTAVAPGATLTATAEGLVPGSTATFVVCRPGGGASADCGSPSPAVRVDRGGQATAPVTVSPGRCPRGGTCAVAVIVGDGGPRAYARLLLVGREGAGYDDGRIALGIAIAGLLFAIALALLVLTDWTPVGGDPFAGVEVPEDPFDDGGRT